MFRSRHRAEIVAKVHQPELHQHIGNLLTAGFLGLGVNVEVS